MNKAFEQRIDREGIVDTKNYRYTITYRDHKKLIVRIPVCKLGTTAAITDWEVVKEYK